MVFTMFLWIGSNNDNDSELRKYKKSLTDLHSHLPPMNAEEENRHKIFEKMKEAVKEDPTKTIKNV